MNLWTYNKQADDFMFYFYPYSPEILSRMREFKLQQQQGPHASIDATNLNHNNINIISIPGKCYPQMFKI